MRFTLRKDLQRTTHRKLSEKLRTFKAGGRYRVAFFQSCRIFARMPDRLEAPVLNITDRKKAFAVFGLMSIRLAIWLVVYPCIRSSRASFSRSVRRNFRAARNRSGCSRSLSNKTAKVAPEWFCKLDFSANNRTW